jgi:hypothetical protein
VCRYGSINFAIGRNISVKKENLPGNFDYRRVNRGLSPISLRTVYSSSLWVDRGRRR